MRVELHPEADMELAAEVEYYEGQELGLGQRFYREVIACLDRIADNPTLPRLRKGYRQVKLRVFRFHVAYSVEGDLVWVLAVARSSRRPGCWKRRMRSQ